MKALNELNVSPLPWKLIPYWEQTNGDPTHGDIQFSDGTTAFMQNTSIDIPKIEDATLFAAAPDLYDGCFELLRYYELPNTNTTVLYNALNKIRAAMKKAGGEEAK